MLSEDGREYIVSSTQLKFGEVDGYLFPTELFFELSGGLNIFKGHNTYPCRGCGNVEIAREILRRRSPIQERKRLDD